MFLTASYLKTSNPKTNTSQKNFWANDENYHYEEQVQLVKKLRASDLKNSELILDLDRKEIVKCRRPKEDSTFETLFEYFQTHYAEYLAALNIV